MPGAFTFDEVEAIVVYVKKMALATEQEKERIAANQAALKAEAISLGLLETATRLEVHQASVRRFQAEHEAEQARKLEEARRQKEARVAYWAERRQKAMKLIFQLGRNPKHGDEQWQSRVGGVLYVLIRSQRYSEVEGEVPVETDRDLVPGRVVLVRRIDDFY